MGIPQDTPPGIKRLFSLEEANALLPEVRTLIDAIQERAIQLTQVQQRLDEFREQKRRGEHVVDGEATLVQRAIGDARRITAEMQERVGALVSLGCELKDVRRGLVDFPALRESRTVYLCWKQGEDEIAYWHELDTGFDGRQPL